MEPHDTLSTSTWEAVADKFAFLEAGPAMSMNVTMR